MSGVKVFFLNGPGTNLYGILDQSLYGAETFDGLRERCERHARTLDIELDFRQSNHEGVLVDWIQEARSAAEGLIINGASLTYTSVSIMDALLAVSCPVVEVHMSNIFKREQFRHYSYISRAATGIIIGLGPAGYEMAITAVHQLLHDRRSS